MNKDNVIIRKAQAQDLDRIWEISQAVLKTEDSYPFYKDSSKEKIMGYWGFGKNHLIVAEINGKMVGFYKMKPNQVDLGDHIVNFGYMIDPKFQGKGIGTLLGKHSIEKAKKNGYSAIQFNAVTKVNTAAIKLWKKLGFSIVGEVPKAHRHPKLGPVSIYVMYKEL